MEARRDALERGETQVGLPSFDEAVLRPVHLDLVGKPFLGPPGRLSVTTDHHS